MSYIVLVSQEILLDAQIEEYRLHVCDYVNNNIRRIIPIFKSDQGQTYLLFIYYITHRNQVNTTKIKPIL